MLYEFVDRTTKLRKEEIEAKLKETIHEKIDPLIETMYKDKDIQDATKYGQQFVDAMNNLIHKYLLSYEYSRSVSFVNGYGIGLDKTFKNKIRDEITRYIMYPEHYNALTLNVAGGCQDLLDVAIQLTAFCSPLREKRVQLQTLHAELTSAIRNEAKGRQSYKALVALGVDMSEFDDALKKTGFLPAVTKLSVDVNLFNNSEES